MRFLYYDAVTEMEKGRRIVGVKSFPLSEEYLRRHFSRTALVPGVVYVEAMAQLLGWLVIASHDFRLSAIMSVVTGARVSPGLRPGFTGIVEGEIVSTSRRDTLGHARITSDGREIARIDRIIYAHFHKVDPVELKSRFIYYSGIKNEVGVGHEG